MSVRIIFAGFCAVLLFVSALCNCTPERMSIGRTIVGSGVTIVRAVDHLVAPGFAAASAAAAEDPERFRRYNVAVTALLMARHALLDAESVMDAVMEGQDGDVRGAIACAVEALMRLFDALPALGVEMPSEVAVFMSLTVAFTGECTPDAHMNAEALAHPGSP